MAQKQEKTKPAKKPKQSETESEPERIYTVPLRREWLKAPSYKRAKRAVNTLRKFLSRHMKCEESNVRIGRWLNMKIWERGIKKPPGKVKIKVKREKIEKEGKETIEIISAELIELPKKALREKEKTEKAKKKKEAKEKKVTKKEEKKSGKKEDKKGKGKTKEKNPNKPKSKKTSNAKVSTK